MFILAISKSSPYYSQIFKIDRIDFTIGDSNFIINKNSSCDEVKIFPNLNEAKKYQSKLKKYQSML